MLGRPEYWNQAYRHGDATRSWYQRQPLPSLHMLDTASVTASNSVIDVGGGASPLVDALLARGHTDLTVLDVSTEALETTRRRLGDAASRVHWLVADLLAWQPERTWDIWHDRAVLHFFTGDGDRRRYLRSLHAATHSGSVAIIATFAPDGPQQCSGLPVARYDTRGLRELLGDDWHMIAETGEEHTTPADTTQPFTWVALRRQG